MKGKRGTFVAKIAELKCLVKEETESECLASERIKEGAEAGEY